MTEGVAFNLVAVMDWLGWIWRLLFLGLGNVGRPIGISRPMALLIQQRLFALRTAINLAVGRGILPVRKSCELRAPRVAATTDPAPNPPPDDAPTLPRCRSWLLRMLPNQNVGAGRRCVIEALEDPDLLALAAGNSVLARHLRSLCHMLGIAPPQELRRPRRKRVVTAPRIRRITQPKPSPFPTPPRNPTPAEQQQAFRRMFGGPEFST